MSSLCVVSYKLTKAEVQNQVTKRKDNFRLDPVIKTGFAILADYKGSGYDRGHLAPAGDMAWSKKAMSDSFFLTSHETTGTSPQSGNVAHIRGTGLYMRYINCRKEEIFQ